MPQYVAGTPYPILSRYEIPLENSAILGKGGMGIVFQAHDRLMDEQVAIKTILPSNINLQAIRSNFHAQLFLREAMTHARLGIRFPGNIVPVRNYGIEDDTPFMEMEIMNGGSLRKRISDAKTARRRGPLFDNDTIKSIILQICAGLKIMHEHKVYHSDLKPENILFSNAGTDSLKITDLGIARIAETGILTRAGINTFFGGTINYTPQNVIEQTQKANERTDLYSAGVILYEMIVREPLKWSQARQDFIEAHSELSRSAKDIIKRACQLMGRNNFKQVEEMQDKLILVNILE